MEEKTIKLTSNDVKTLLRLLNELEKFRPLAWIWENDSIKLQNKILKQLCQEEKKEK